MQRFKIFPSEAYKIIFAWERNKLLNSQRILDIGGLDQTPSECAAAFEFAFAKQIPARTPIKNVLVASAPRICADNILNDVVIRQIKVPFVQLQNEKIPSFVSENTLSMVLDSPFWHDEARDILEQCAQAESNVVFITHEDFSTAESAIADNVFVLRLPKSLRRFINGEYYFIPALAILSQITELHIDRQNFDETQTAMKKVSADQAESIVKSIAGKAIFIYGMHDTTVGVASQWREQIHQTTQLATAYEFPEGISEPFLLSPELGIGKQIIFLRDCDENNKDREKLRGVAEQDAVPIIEIFGEGNSKFSRICHLVYLGDVIKYYLEAKIQ